MNRYLHPAASHQPCSQRPEQPTRRCIKEAVAGAIAGHKAGHGKLGELAHCAIGPHEVNTEQERDVNTEQERDPITAGSELHIRLDLEQRL